MPALAPRARERGRHGPHPRSGSTAATCGSILDQPKANIVSTRDDEGAAHVALAKVEDSPAIKLVTIEGAGEHFSFGASVEEHRPAIVDHVLPLLHDLVRELLAVPAPTAAIVRGRCLGGGFELALACDLIFVSTTAQLGVPEIVLGVFPPAATALLPHRIGASRAAGAILSGQVRPAEKWRDAGLIELTAPPEELAAAVDHWFHDEPGAAVGGGAALRGARHPHRHPPPRRDGPAGARALLPRDAHADPRRRRGDRGVPREAGAEMERRMRAVDYLHFEHRRVEEMLVALEAAAIEIETSGNPPAFASDILDFFVQFVDEGHETKEDAFLFPAMARHGVAPEGMIAAMKHQHEVGRIHLRDMRRSLDRVRLGTVSARAAFATSARSYAELMRVHIQIEDDDLYPVADELLTAGENKALLKAFQMADTSPEAVAQHARWHVLVTRIHETARH